MPSMLTCLVRLAPAAALAGAAALGQNSAQTDDERPEIEDERPEIERCATVPNLFDVAVLDDWHVYLRTRGSNHYLFSLEHCEDLHRAYLRDDVALVPYGRRICEGDGSYIAYLKGGRREHCDIVTIRRVQSRAEARELAGITPSPVTFEPLGQEEVADDSRTSGDSGEQTP